MISSEWRLGTRCRCLKWRTRCGNRRRSLPALIECQLAEMEQNGQQKLFEEIELAPARVLADMEAAGFAVDAGGIAAFGKTMQEEIDRLQEKIYEEVGYV